MELSVGRANAKAILLGEHAVVYGVPAIAVGLDRGAAATARAAEVATIRIGDRNAVAHDESELGRAFGALVQTLGARPASVEVTLEIPPGVGLGASATIAVAAARALAGLEGADDERVMEAAMAWERVFHGNPSGIDAWAAAHRGCFTFVRGEGVKPLVVARPLHVCIAIAGPAASTRAMVEGVARFRDRKRELADRSFEAIRALVMNAALCIEAGDIPGLGKLLDLNQMLLAGLFLSTPDLERACAIAREAGAFGAKLTGAGGGGCVLALTGEETSPVLDAWRAKSIDCFATVIPATNEKSE